MLFLALAAVFLGLQWRPFLVIGFTAGSPFFFRLSEDGIDFGSSVFAPRPGVVLPLLVFAAPLCLSLAPKLVWDRLPSNQADRLVVAFVGWSCLVFATTFAVTREAAPLVLIQILAPVVFYLVGRGADRDDDAWDFITGLVIGVTATCLWLALSEFSVPHNPAYGERIGDELVGGLTLYQAYDYFPILTVIASVCGAAWYVQTRQLLALWTSLVTAMMVLLLYSRSGIASLVVAGSIFAWRERARFSPRTGALAVAGFAAAFVASLTLGLPAVSRIVDTVNPARASADNSNRVRANAISNAARIVIRNPVIGRGFRPTGRDPATKVSKTLNSHDQYLDYAVRAGVPLAAILIALLGLVARDSWRLPTSGRGPPYSALIAATIAAACVSNLVQSTYIEPLTAFPLWLILGLLVTAVGRVPGATAEGTHDLQAAPEPDTSDHAPAPEPATSDRAPAPEPASSGVAAHREPAATHAVHRATVTLFSRTSVLLARITRLLGADGERQAVQWVTTSLALTLVGDLLLYAVVDMAMWALALCGVGLFLISLGAVMQFVRLRPAIKHPRHSARPAERGDGLDTEAEGNVAARADDRNEPG